MVNAISTFNTSEILKKKNFSRADIISLLSTNKTNLLQDHAIKVLYKECGSEVFYRGLLEFSNICRLDCLYCGIRKTNSKVVRYNLSEKEITDSACWAAEQGYGSIVLQSGERQDTEFTDFVERIVKKIKSKTKSSSLPDGLGITLSLGEQSNDTYKRWFNAGAHRYLLRIETTSEKLFNQIHPEDQSFSNRIKCLRLLKSIGFQVGTGVMIGLPNQSISDLADDILFFKNNDIDMIGMGPFIPHKDTPMGKPRSSEDTEKIFQLSLNMVAVARIVLRDVNIAASTALQAIHPAGREKALAFGANIIMPLITPANVRKNYTLYDGKPCINEKASDCRHCLQMRVESIGRQVCFNKWGDSPHYKRRETYAN